MCLTLWRGRRLVVSSILVREDVRADFGHPPRADVTERPLHFIRQDLDRPRRAGLSAACGAIERRPADQHHLRTERQCLDDVAAAANAAVEYDGAAIADRFNNFRQHVDRRNGAVESASAVIRY